MAAATDPTLSAVRGEAGSADDRPARNHLHWPDAGINAGVCRCPCARFGCNLQGKANFHRDKRGEDETYDRLLALLVVVIWREFQGNQVRPAGDAAVLLADVRLPVALLRSLYPAPDHPRGNGCWLYGMTAEFPAQFAFLFVAIKVGMLAATSWWLGGSAGVLHPAVGCRADGRKAARQSFRSRSPTMPAAACRSYRPARMPGSGAVLWRACC